MDEFALMAARRKARSQTKRRTKLVCQPDSSLGYGVLRFYHQRSMCISCCLSPTSAKEKIPAHRVCTVWRCYCLSTPTATRDEFSGVLLGADWEWYLPDDGPTYAVTDGQLKLIVPPGFEHWNSDHSSQLWRTDLGDYDWRIETQLGAINAAPDAGYQDGA